MGIRQEDATGTWIIETDGDRAELMAISKVLKAAAHEGAGGKRTDGSKLTLSFNGSRVAVSTNVELFFFAVGLQFAASTPKQIREEADEASRKLDDALGKALKGSG